MKTLRGWLVLALIASFLFFVGVNWAEWVAAADRHEGLAAWVQAVGSILALAVAVWIPWNIHLREQRIVLMPRQRKLLLLKDALGRLQKAVETYLAVADEFPTDQLENVNYPVIGEQLRKYMEIYLIFETDLAGAMDKCSDEIFEGLKDVEQLQSVTASRRAMISAEIHGLKRYNEKIKVVAISKEKVTEAFREIEPYIVRAIDRLKL